MRGWMTLTHILWTALYCHCSATLSPPLPSTYYAPFPSFSNNSTAPFLTVDDIISFMRDSAKANSFSTSVGRQKIQSNRSIQNATLSPHHTSEQLLRVWGDGPQNNPKQQANPATTTQEEIFQQQQSSVQWHSTEHRERGGTNNLASRLDRSPQERGRRKKRGAELERSLRSNADRKRSVYENIPPITSQRRRSLEVQNSEQDEEVHHNQRLNQIYLSGSLRGSSSDYFLRDNLHRSETMSTELPPFIPKGKSPSVFSPSNVHEGLRCRRNAIQSYRSRTWTINSNEWNNQSTGRNRRSTVRCKRRSFLGVGPPSFHVSSPKNITAQLGASAYLPCRIKNLGNKSVSWFRKRDSHILTVDRNTFIADDRFSAWHEGGTQSWTLRIQYAQFRDAGDYECQVSTICKRHSAEVSTQPKEPSAVISGTQDQFVRAGSTVTLTCELHNTVEEPSFIFWYQDGTRLIHAAGGRLVIGAAVRVASDRHASSLTIRRAAPRDSGNYTCAPASIDPASVTLHVLHDEHPAAMQHGTTNRGPAAVAATTAVTAVVVCQLVMSANVQQPSTYSLLALVCWTAFSTSSIALSFCFNVIKVFDIHNCVRNFVSITQRNKQREIDKEGNPTASKTWPQNPDFLEVTEVVCKLESPREVRTSKT
ncbi:uncharacterized protein LOC108675815 [Hyalella azteca]|uniref:Uncharacterized protein LOC108675815 n=1 Tax=Hyalella azteca TaxID=294128 RepID=A0A8B7NZZ0_HYAAZ|nr:uncharacterized protein LOC108675815 [Hyalella azteca]